MDKTKLALMAVSIVGVAFVTALIATVLVVCSPAFRTAADWIALRFGMTPVSASLGANNVLVFEAIRVKRLSLLNDAGIEVASLAYDPLAGASLKLTYPNGAKGEFIVSTATSRLEFTNSAGKATTAIESSGTGGKLSLRTEEGTPFITMDAQDSSVQLEGDTPHITLLNGDASVVAGIRTEGNAAKVFVRTDTQIEGKEYSNYAELASSRYRTASGVRIKSVNRDDRNVDITNFTGDGLSLLHGAPAMWEDDVNETRKTAGLNEFLTGMDAAQRLTIGINDDGEPLLSMRDKGGNTRVVLGAAELINKESGTTTKRSPASLVLFNQKGTVSWATPE